MNNENTGLFVELCECFAPSGCEDRALGIIEKEIKKHTDVCKRDKLGNLICVKYADTPSDRRPIMVCTHVDEASFMVNEISQDGYLYFSPLGKTDARTVCGKHIIVGRNEGAVKGIISSKAIHHQTAEERKTATPIDKMYADIGVSSKEDAKAFADIGDYIVFDSPISHFGDKANMFRGKAVDARISSMALIELAASLKNTKRDVYFAFATRGNLVYPSVTAAVHAADPEYLYVVNSLEATDYYPVREKNGRICLGDGPVLTFADKRAVYSYTLTKEVERLARNNKINIQINSQTSGETFEASAAQLSAGGARCVSLSVPARYCGTANPVVSLDDCESLSYLLKLCIDKISEDNLEG